MQWGVGTDKPVAADYTGDGRIDLAIFRPTDGNWWIFDLSTNSQLPLLNWGLAGDTPTPADYDGDGRADVATVRQEIFA